MAVTTEPRAGLQKGTNWWGAFVIGLAGTILVTGIAPYAVQGMGASAIWAAKMETRQVAAVMANRPSCARSRFTTGPLPAWLRIWPQSSTVASSGSMIGISSRTG